MSPLFMINVFMTEKEQIEKIVEDSLNDESLFLVSVEVVGTGSGKRKVTITVDSDKGITIEECARISRETGKAIEEGEIIKTEYVLDVTSPGIGSVLMMPRQYTKNIGRQVKIKSKSGEEFTGELKAIENGIVELVEKPKGKRPGIEHKFTLEEIDWTKVLVTFK